MVLNSDPVYNVAMKRSYLGMVIFGILSVYSGFLLYSGESPGILIIVGLVGFVVSLGDYLSAQK